MRRVAVRALIALGALGLFLVLVVIPGGYLYLRQSLPVVDGRVEVTGLTSGVTIVRDRHAVPHIQATTRADGLFGLGYAHAQDRLWQMEFQRRIGHGRLSELFGTATLSQDRFLRTVGFGRAAQSAWDHLPGDVRALIDAYVAGVNAFISSHRGRLLPPEFHLIGVEPEPFSGVDVLVWVKMMAWDLSANYSQELMRHDLHAKVGARMSDLLPPYPVDGLSIVKTHLGGAPPLPAAGTPPAATTSAAFSAALEAGLHEGLPAVADFLLKGGRVEALGSNNWVIDGTMSASGKPMLANDPHLGTKMPSLWYLAHVSAGDFEMAGATLPGAPAVALGRNRHIAWGATNVAADVEDLYLEHLDDSGKAAEFRGAFEPLRMVRETIGVKGAAPVVVDVRITRHGPLISDALNAINAASTAAEKPAPLPPMAFRWTALDETDDTVAAFMRINAARNWTEFVDAMRAYTSPTQNFVYGDVDGHIGYFAPGHIPVRASGDGAMPVEGWTGEHEWTGWIPFDELPQAYDPPDHYIVTANHRPMPASYPYLIALEYPDPYRAQRITDLLSGRSKLTPDDFRAIQADTLSLHAARLVPALLAHLTQPSARVLDAAQRLRAWDFDARGDSAAEAIFQAWFLRLAPTIAGDELGTALNGYRGRFSFVSRFVLGLTQGGDAAWCDDVSTSAVESCDQTITRALELGLADLTTAMGDDMSRWRWDGVHRAVFPHQPLDSQKILRWFLSRSVPNGGDWSTVNVGPASADSPFDQVSVPGYRQVIDLSPANDSWFLDAVGQSGHFLSPFYDDALTEWQEVRLRKMRLSTADINDGAIGTLTLIPAGR